jgi:hypothetical protein
MIGLGWPIGSVSGSGGDSPGGTLTSALSRGPLALAPVFGSYGAVAESVGPVLAGLSHRSSHRRAHSRHILDISSPDPHRRLPPSTPAWTPSPAFPGRDCHYAVFARFHFVALIRFSPRAAMVTIFPPHHRWCVVSLLSSLFRGTAAISSNWSGQFRMSQSSRFAIPRIAV